MYVFLLTKKKRDIVKNSRSVLKLFFNRCMCFSAPWKPALRKNQISWKILMKLSENVVNF